MNRIGEMKVVRSKNSWKAANVAQGHDIWEANSRALATKPQKLSQLHTTYADPTHFLEAEEPMTCEQSQTSM